MRRFLVRFVGATSAALIGSAPVAAAQGYGVYEQSACPSGRAGTGVAAVCDDGSGIFYNPASIVFSPRVLSAGASLIAPNADFTNALTGRVSELEDKVYPVPHLYYIHPIGTEGRYAAGIGVFAPYGLATEWPDTSETRFLGYKSRVQAIYIQPTAAVRLSDRFSIGAGFDLSLVSVELRQRIDLAEQTAAPGITFAQLGVPFGTDFADLGLEGDATGVGYHIGVQFRATDRITLGARYLSRQLIEFDDGEADFTQVETGLVLPPSNPAGAPAGTPVDALVAGQFAEGAPLGDQSGSTFLRLPDQLVVGVQAQVTDRIKVLFDYQFTNWSVFEELRIDFERLPTVTIPEDYDEAHGFRLGGEYAFSPTTTGRAGFYYHTDAAPPQSVTPNLPIGERTSFTLGLGTGLTSSLGVDLYYQYIDQPDRRGRTIEGPITNGLYTSTSHLLGATLAYAF